MKTTQKQNRNNMEIIWKHYENNMRTTQKQYKNNMEKYGNKMGTI